MGAPFTFRLAASHFQRIRGLLDSKVCAQGEVLVLTACNSIHTFGMRGPLDVAFMDAEGRILAAHRAVPPNQLRTCRKAACTLERRARTDEAWFMPGETAGLTVGLSMVKRGSKT